jgi:hypothetical protein
MIVRHLNNNNDNNNNADFICVLGSQIIGHLESEFDSVPAPK